MWLIACWGYSGWKRDEQRQAFLGGPPGSLLDGHQVEVVAELAAVADHLKLHGHQVAELRDAQPVDFPGRLKKVLRAALVRVQELDPGSGEDAVEGSRRALGDGERARRGQSVGQLVEVDAAVVEEEVQVPADPVPEVDGTAFPGATPSRASSVSSKPTSQPGVAPR
jgi:hypothetical protein